MCGAEWIGARFIQYTRESVARTAIDFKLYISNSAITSTTTTYWHRLSFFYKMAQS